MDRSHNGGRAAKPAKRVWSRSTKPHSARLDEDEARKLRQLVRRLRMSQSRVLALGLDRLHRAVIDGTED